MKVYFIGAGPGNHELLTIKAADIIKKSDMIIYAGSLINKEILRYAKDDALLHDSAKMNIKEIIDKILSCKNEDRIVARLHSGDPSIYGAILEQMLELDKYDIDYEVVPGISSFVASGHNYH